jgi:hypothetical protein
LAPEIDSNAVAPVIKALVAGSKTPSNYANFDDADNPIFISRNYLPANADHPAAIQQALLEQFGHYVELQITAAAPGESGAMFAALVLGQTLTEPQLQVLSATTTSAINDHRFHGRVQCCNGSRG